MAYTIDRSAMESAFSTDVLVTLPDRSLSMVMHRPSRTFLAEIGLPLERVSLYPYATTAWFSLEEGLLEGATRVADAWAGVDLDEWGLPSSAADWVPLGTIANDFVLLDGATGAVHSIPEGDTREHRPYTEIVTVPDEQREAHLLNKDLHSFAYFLYVLEKERPNYDVARSVKYLHPDGIEKHTADPATSARRIYGIMKDFDRSSFDNPHSTWYATLDGVYDIIPA